jgi:hypothetical protein
MSGTLRAFYYPSSFARAETVKKALLMFDELHLMDRPSFTFGNFGMVGSASPLRGFDKSFQNEGVPFYIHGAPGGPAHGETLEQTEADVNDVEFLLRFQRGLAESEVFRDMQIHHGNYGPAGTHVEVARKPIDLDIRSALEGRGRPMDVFADKAIKHFEMSSHLETLKHLISSALTCSAVLNFALQVGQKEGFSPMADCSPFAKLIGAKYSRAARGADSEGFHIQPTDISIAIFDELVSPERLAKLTIAEVIRYRKQSNDARKAFLEHVVSLEARQSTIPFSTEYSSEVQKIVKSEILPAAREFRNQLEKIYDDLFGKVAKGALAYLGSSAALELFGDISWQNLLRLAGVAGAAVAGQAIDARNEVRSVKRECAISYLLDLENN